MAADADQKVTTAQGATIADALVQLDKAEKELDAALGILANAYARKRSPELLNFVAMANNAHLQVGTLHRQAINDKIAEKG